MRVGEVVGDICCLSVVCMYVLPMCSYLCIRVSISVSRQSGHFVILLFVEGRRVFCFIFPCGNSFFRFFFFVVYVRSFYFFSCRFFFFRFFFIVSKQVCPLLLLLL